MRIEKSYAPWIHGVGGALEAIQKAERMSDLLQTADGAKLYMKYLDEGGGVGSASSFGSIMKSQPTPGDVHVNVPLTMISIAYLASQQFIADKVFPIIPVSKQSDKYYKYPKDQWFRTDAQKRPPGATSAGSGYTLETDTYSADVWALHKDVPDQVRANADAMINPDRDATMFVTHQLALRREKDWAARFFTTGLWTGSTTGGDITPVTLWDAPNSTPIQDLEAEITSVETKTGFKPNTVVLGKKSWITLKNHPDFLDRIKYTETGIVSLSLLAAVLEVDRVLVAAAVENTAAEGATPVMGRVMTSEDAFVCYAAPQPSLMAPSAGYMFAWTGYTGAGPAGQRIKRFRDEPKSSDVVEGEMAYDMKLVASDLGAFFDGTVS